jgi:hypothetical protein
MSSSSQGSFQQSRASTPTSPMFAKLFSAKYNEYSKVINHDKNKYNEYSKVINHDKYKYKE